MGNKTRERVRSGELSIADAMKQVSPDCKTYAWLKRKLEAAKRLPTDPRV